MATLPALNILTSSEYPLTAEPKSLSEILLVNQFGRFEGLLWYLYVSKSMELTWIMNYMSDRRLRAP
jgi:hypothetical protein